MYTPQDQDFLIRPYGIYNHNETPKYYTLMRFFQSWRFENIQSPEQIEEYIKGAGLEFVEGWGGFSKPCGYYRIKGIDNWNETIRRLNNGSV